MFGLFKSKKTSGVVVRLSPMESSLLHSAFENAQKRMETAMKIHGLPDREKIEAVRRWPDLEQVYLLSFDVHWATELAKRPSSITLATANECRVFINTIELMHRFASEDAHIHGTKADLVGYGGAVGVVNGVIARIKATARIS